MCGPGLNPPDPLSQGRVALSATYFDGPVELVAPVKGESQFGSRLTRSAGEEDVDDARTSIRGRRLPIVFERLGVLQLVHYPGQWCGLNLRLAEQIATTAR
jgi:hypothetical protein